MKKMFSKIVVMAILATTIYSCSNNEILDDSELSVETMEQLISKLPNIEGASLLVPNQYIIIYNTNSTGKFNNRGSYSANKASVRSFTENLLIEKNIQNAAIVYTYSDAVAGVTLRLTENQMNTLKNDDRIAIIEQDRITQFAPPCGTPNGGPCDPGGGGGTGDSAQEIPWGIARVNGVTSYTGNSVAWIIDSGIDLTHSDLNVNQGRGFNAFTSGKDAQSLNDLNGHGSHVSGTIAAINNKIGVIGVAPGATVVPVKVLDRRGSGAYSGVIAGVDHVAANGNNGDVANMSLGGPISTALEMAITSAAQYSGVTFLLAGGNESQNANNVSPARLNGNNIYTISAMSQGDNWASFSNFANPPIDYCAPGVNVKSTWKNGGYNTISGTSMATPHAAGVFLLGNPLTDGKVNGDPDGNADPIIVH